MQPVAFVTQFQFLAFFQRVYEPIDALETLFAADDAERKLGRKETFATHRFRTVPADADRFEFLMIKTFHGNLISALV
jgi:hypothetical protein